MILRTELTESGLSRVHVAPVTTARLTASGVFSDGQ